jgi:hypothetical protein
MRITIAIQAKANTKHNAIIERNLLHYESPACIYSQQVHGQSQRLCLMITFRNMRNVEPNSWIDCLILSEAVNVNQSSWVANNLGFGARRGACIRGLIGDVGPGSPAG